MWCQGTEGNDLVPLVAVDMAWGHHLASPAGNHLHLVNLTDLALLQQCPQRGRLDTDDLA
jgi:hypothetical protein